MQKDSLTSGAGPPWVVSGLSCLAGAVWVLGGGSAKQRWMGERVERRQVMETHECGWELPNSLAAPSGNTLAGARRASVDPSVDTRYRRAWQQR